MPDLGVLDLSTGVRSIDADTEAACFLLARVFAPLAECRRRFGPCDHCQCTRIGAIMRFMAGGFDRQQNMMEAASYPLADEHRFEHAALLDQLAAMRDAGICADDDAPMVRETLIRWLMRHNRAFDRPLGNWALTRRIAVAV